LNWIQEGGEARAFDLIREQEQLRDATRQAIAEVVSSALAAEYKISRQTLYAALG